jgi:uncharacterized membrane protein
MNRENSNNKKDSAVKEVLWTMFAVVVFISWYNFLLLGAYIMQKLNFDKSNIVHLFFYFSTGLIMSLDVIFNFYNKKVIDPERGYRWTLSNEFAFLTSLLAGIITPFVFPIWCLTQIDKIYNFVKKHISKLSIA